MTMTKPTLAEFWDALDGHDWFHPMTEDSGYRQSARARELELREAARGYGGEFEEMLDAFSLSASVYMAGGKTWEKPERPGVEA